MSIYQFAFHENVPEKKPFFGGFDHLHEMLERGEKIHREDKDWLVQKLYGVFGYSGPIAKSMGWAWDFTEFLNLYLVKQYGEWHEYRSFDKTSLRKALHGPIEKIILVN